MSLQKTIEGKIADLPSSAQIELLDFIHYLHFKYRDNEKKNIVLKGLWADNRFNILQEDIRSLRQEVSTQILDKYSSDDLSR